MFEDVFAVIARDDAGMVEVQIRFQKAFIAPVATDREAFGDAARRHSATALKRTEAALTQGQERYAVRAVAERIGTAISDRRRHAQPEAVS